MFCEDGYWGYKGYIYGWWLAFFKSPAKLQCESALRIRQELDILTKSVSAPSLGFSPLKLILDFFSGNVKFRLMTKLRQKEQNKTTFTFCLRDN